MTLQEALEHFFASDKFNERSSISDNEGESLVKNKARFDNGMLGNVTAVAMLEKYGYTIQEIIVLPPGKKKRRSTSV